MLPDYYEEYPKPCMGGWGRDMMVITPNGDVLPCQAAASIPGLEFGNVREHSLSEIWFESEAFNRFRGTDWMPELCRNCPADRQEVDFGGCRCQALALARRRDADRSRLPLLTAPLDHHRRGRRGEPADAQRRRRADLPDDREGSGRS